MEIRVNGIRHDLPRGDVTYEDIARLAGHPDAQYLSVTYYWRGEGDLQRQGILSAGRKVAGEDGMIFDAYHTGNA